MESTLFIITVSQLLSLTILIGMLLIILNFKVWAQGRDRYYREKLDGLEKRVRQLEEKHLNEIADILKENKDILEKLKTGFQKKK